MAAWVAAGAAIVGDVMSQQGQKQTNQQNMDLQIQNENWQTQMSNTAMQRRVQDMEAAGLNPLLAAGTPGATVPGVASAVMNNPNAAFGQLGSQVASAEQLRSQSAQIENIKADTALKEQSRTDVVPAQIKQIQADTQTSLQQAQVVHNNIEEVLTHIMQMREQTAQTVAQRMQTEQGIEITNATKIALEQITNNAAKASAYGLPELSNMSDMMRSKLGMFLTFLRGFAGPVNSAVSAASKLGAVAP